jgi:hypothetical protein
MTAPFPAYGQVPLASALYHLAAHQVIAKWPAGPLPEVNLTIVEGTRTADVIKCIELATSWVFDEKSISFYLPTATHSEDNPDTFGRATRPDRVPVDSRALVVVSFRFRRVSGGVSYQGANAGVTFTSFSASVPEGVVSSWSNSQSRSYFEGVTAVDAQRPGTIQTVRRTVDAGLQLDGVAARLPGGRYRLNARLEVSSFLGTGLDKALVRIPLDVDSICGSWDTVYRVYGADANATAAFHGQGLTFAATGDVVEVQVRVE